MSWEEFTEALEELYMDVEEVAEKLGLEVDEVKAWDFFKISFDNRLNIFAMFLIFKL